MSEAELAQAVSFTVCGAVLLGLGFSGLIEARRRTGKSIAAIVSGIGLFLLVMAFL